MLTVAVLGCGTDGGLVFGEFDSACPASQRLNQEEQFAAVNCFLGEVDAGRAVVWDVLRTTVEGDPVPIRYEYDGTRVTIVEDTTRDQWGEGRVAARTCVGVRVGPIDGLPVGVDCEKTGSTGFSDQGLSR